MDIERNVVQATADINAALANENAGHDPYAVVQRANAPRATRRDFMHYFGRWQNLRVLIGTAYSWFAIDVRSPDPPGLRTPAQSRDRWHSIPWD
jgi:PHS family inorganic phosphate transporter-like MFS transporter